VICVADQILQWFMPMLQLFRPINWSVIDTQSVLVVFS
jgi:hypothetical protein